MDTQSDEAARAWRRSVRARVFVAEDDAAMRNLVVSTLLNDGHEVYEAASGEELLRLMGAIAVGRRAEAVNPPCGVDLVVLDHRMPVIKGLSVARRLRRARWSVPLILMTAFPSDELVHEAHQLNVHVLAKPFSLRDLSESALSLLLTETNRFAQHD
jgi:two-component system cell cycle sensor histidine kinase/response regulator CckA